MKLVGRGFKAGIGYRFGFNGKENDNEVKGEGNQIDYGMRVYDPRVGRFLSVDPLFEDYPWYTPYQFAGNSPIANVDLDGEEEKHYLVTIEEKTGKAQVKLTKDKPTNSALWGLFEWTAPYRNIVEYNGSHYSFYGKPGTPNYDVEFQKILSDPEGFLAEYPTYQSDEDALTQYMIEAGSVIAMGTVSTYKATGRNQSVTTPKSQQKTRTEQQTQTQQAKPASHQKAATNPETASNVETQPKVNSGVTDPTKNRVKLKKETLKKIEENQPRNDKGQMIDPNTKKPLQPGKVDVGHKPGQEWRKRKKMHQEKGSTRKEVIEEENDPNLYQLQDRNSNRGHKHEQKDN